MSRDDFLPQPEAAERDISQLRAKIATVTAELEQARLDLQDEIDAERAALAAVTAELTDERNRSAESERDYQNERLAHAETRKALEEMRQARAGATAAYESTRAELAKALRAYDDEVTGRREEVTRCHAEMGRIRQKYQDALRTVGTSNAELAKAESRIESAVSMAEAFPNATDLVDRMKEALRG